MEKNCDHIGPRPIGYCVDNKMIECVYSNHRHRWFVQMTEYNDSNCNETVINKHKLPCLEDTNCQCGKGICPQNKIITIEQNNGDQFKSECVETFKIIIFIKNHCIPSEFIQLTLNNSTVSNSINFQDGKHYSSVNQIMLKCDDKLQQLSYYEYDDNKCNGDPVLAEPEILIDFVDYPCINIDC